MDWQLATESIVVRIRWFGIAMGYALVETRNGLNDPWAVRAILALGACYAALDLLWHRRGQVFLSRLPLFVSMMEATFIGLLCYFDTGLESPFRWYYLLSLICCSIRYRPTIAWLTFGFHCLSLIVLAVARSGDAMDPAGLPLTVVILAWATWATSALSSLLQATGERLARANLQLERHGADLERRVEERTEALRASQARVIHQEKMAAFGLLAAGIAHEVGNPLAALSSLVQMLQRRDPDAYTAGKLEIALNQLDRIRRTIRELVDFSRPASPSRGRVRLEEILEEALGIAKYYHRTKERAIVTEVEADLPVIHATRDHLTQVVLNLVLNAIDATEKEGRIFLKVGADREAFLVMLRVEDDGRGVRPADRDRLFQPYFTTKPQGTGLGLFVSRQIVEELGGTLSYEPGDGGRGTVFTIRLPARFEVPALVGSVESAEEHLS